MALAKGRISKEEDRFIQKNVEAMSYEEIATKLNRNPDSINDYIKKNYNIGVTVEEQAAYQLKDRPYYYELKCQFDEEELELFGYHWSRIVSQFNNDVLPTEEMQIVDVIKIDMLMNRCLKTNKDNIRSINRLSLQVENLITDPEGLEQVLNMERQLGALRSGQEALNRDYRDLQSKKSAMLKEMKGTREQRIKRLEDSKESFGSWVAALVQNPDKLKKYGIDMEKMRLATEKERLRFSKLHKYADGTIDQPFLNSDTVL